MTAFPFVLLLAALLGWYLMNTLRRARQVVEPAPVRYEVRARAFCPHCGEAVTSGYLDKLRAELGRWRPGIFRRPCTHCQQLIVITVEELQKGTP